MDRPAKLRPCRSARPRTWCGCGRSCGSWAVELGFSLVDQTKIVTAASELARNTRRPRRRRDGAAGSRCSDGGRAGLAADVRGQGPGHRRTSSWRCRTATRPASGLGLGLGGARRLSNEFEHRVAARRGHARDDRPVDDDARLGSSQSASSDRARSREARRARGGPGRHGSASTRPTRAGSALVVTEAATNLVKHAGGGEILVQRARTRRAAASRSWRSIGGPASPTSHARSRDGYSTAGSPRHRAGRDPPRLRRRSTSTRGPGRARPCSPRLAPVAAPRVPSRGLDVGGCDRSRSPGRRCRGDAWASAAARGGVSILVADGLGHGPGAPRPRSERRRRPSTGPAASPAEASCESCTRALRAHPRRGGGGGRVDLGTERLASRASATSPASSLGDGSRAQHGLA